LRSGFLRGGVLLAFATIMSLVSPGRAGSSLRPGLFASWRIELLADGKRSEERFSMTVKARVEDELWRIELERGNDAGLYRVLYRAGGDKPAFDPSRIEGMEERVDDRWRPIDPEELRLLDRVREMEAGLSGAEELGDTLVSVDGSPPLRCSMYRLNDEGETIQEGETVRLRTHWKTGGEVWISPEVPLGAWVRYRELRETKRFSEFGGQVFEGETQSSVTEWILDELRLP